MVRKLSLLLTAVAVVAFAAPAFASAAPQVTYETGVTAKATSPIKGTNTGNIVLQSSTLGAIECATLTIEGALTKNNGTEVEGSSGGLFTSASCTNNGNPVTVTEVVVTNLKSTVSGEGTASFKTVVDVNGTTCTFTTSTPAKFTYTSGMSSISFSKAGKATSTACGSATLTGTFDIDAYEGVNGNTGWRTAFLD